MSEKINKSVAMTLPLNKAAKFLKFLPLDQMLHVKRTGESADCMPKSYVTSLPQCNKDVDVKD